MVTATSIEAVAMYHGYAGGASCMVSEEQMALAEFARRLGSVNFTNEPGIVDETRKEAKLLMSLMLSTIPPTCSDTAPEFERVSSSDHSYASDSSSLSSSRRADTFTFTCPSLSLENPDSSHLKCNSAPTTTWIEQYLNASEPPPRPAILLGRPLKVDDRDALRLSADAMARNVLQSFQKAMDWRLRTWIFHLSKKLATQERSMLNAGSSEEDIKALLNTPEAALLVALRGIAEENLITFQSTSTSFEVLSKRADENTQNQGSKERKSHELWGMDALASEAHRQLSNAVDANTATTASAEDEGYYQYTVSHHLQFSCVVHMETPAGFSEIKITVPGTCQGAFQSSPQDPIAELRSVSIDLDTNILAAIVEKSCRAIIRSTVEVAAAMPEQVEGEEKTEEDAPEATLAPVSTPPRITNPAAFVTPRSVSQESDCGQEIKPSVLLPIPDDFGRRSDKPRRISPQPTSTNFLSAATPPTFGPRASTKRESPTNDTTTSVKRRLPLISPLAPEQNFHEVAANGPSLPMLVEAACRAKPVD